MNEIIHRSLLNPRVLDFPMFPEAVQHTSTCPHARKQVPGDELLELDEPAITVEITPGGAIVGRGNKQLEKEPLRVRIDKFGNIFGTD